MADTPTISTPARRTASRPDVQDRAVPRTRAGRAARDVRSSMPVLAQLVQLPAAWMVERRGDRRPITVWSSLGRMFWLIPQPALSKNQSSRRTLPLSSNAVMRPASRRVSLPCAMTFTLAGRAAGSDERPKLFP